MAKVTSKLQVTLPMRLAQRFQISPGDEIEWQEGGDAIRVVPVRAREAAPDLARRLDLFDQATARQRDRERSVPRLPRRRGSGWTREELYDRGRAGRHQRPRLPFRPRSPR